MLQKIIGQLLIKSEWSSEDVVGFGVEYFGYMICYLTLSSLILSKILHLIKTCWSLKDIKCITQHVHKSVFLLH